MCWLVKMTVLRHWAEIQYCKNALKSKEIKTDASFFDETFVSILNSIFAIYISGRRGRRRIETLNWKRLRLDVIYSKIPKILKWIAFPFDIVLFPFTERIAFESSTKIRLSTSYDPKPAQLSWRHNDEDACRAVAFGCHLPIRLRTQADVSSVSPWSSLADWITKLTFRALALGRHLPIRLRSWRFEPSSFVVTYRLHYEADGLSVSPFALTKG